MFGRLTPMVKNLLIINVGVHFIGYLMGNSFGDALAFHGFQSPKFQPYQFFTYMFLHAPGFGHIFFNMIGLFIFGPILENFWGSNRFLKYYLITAIGAGLLFAAVDYWEFKRTERAVERYIERPAPEEFYGFLRENFSSFRHQPSILTLAESYDDNPDSESYRDASIEIVLSLKEIIRDSRMVGASGAIFGLLIAVGLLFPNTQMMLIIPPIPVKMKYLALVMGGMAIYGALNPSPGDNVAHFAHLGGMLVGFIMIRIWNKDRTKFY